MRTINEKPLFLLNVVLCGANATLWTAYSHRPWIALAFLAVGLYSLFELLPRRGY